MLDSYFYNRRYSDLVIKHCESWGVQDKGASLMSVKARLSQPRVANQLGSHQCNAVVLIFAETEIDERHARIIIIQHNINKEKWWGPLVTDLIHI
jgi:hypothetical protein